jgi:WD40 repeat protein
MFVTKVKIATALLLVAGLVAFAALLSDSPKAAQPSALAARRQAEAPLGNNGTAAPRMLKLDGRGRRVAWSPDGKTLAVAEKYASGSAVTLWDVHKGKVRETLAESPLKGLAFQDVVFSPDGKRIAATFCEEVQRGDSMLIRSMLKVWDTQSLTLKQALGGDADLVCVAFSPDGKLLAAGDPGKKTVMLWNAGTGALARTLETGEVQPWSVAFSPDGKGLVVGGQKEDHSGAVMLWRTETGKLQRTLKPDDFVHRAVFSPNGKMVASCGGGAEVDLWDVQSGRRIASLPGLGSHGTRSNVAFSPDGKTVAAGSREGTVLLWAVPSGKLKETLQGHAGEIHAVAFSPDGRTLASVSQDQTVRLWRVSQRAAGQQ